MRQSATTRATLLLLALGSSACARTTEEWQRDLVSTWANPFDRGLAAIALAEQAPDRARGAVVPLLAILDGPDGPLRPHAAEALRKIAPWSAAEMVDVLVHASFLSEDTRIPLEAAIASAGDRAMWPLLAAEREPGRLDPRQIERFFRKIEPPPVEALIAIARDPADPGMAARATRILGDLGPIARRAVPALLEALRGENEDLARPAAAALGRIDPGGATVLADLRAALADPRLSVRLEAARSIAYSCILRAAAADGSEREAGLREAIRLGDPAHPILLELIATGAPKRERAAREALLAIAAGSTLLPPSARPPPASLPRLLASLDDADASARSSAAFELGRMGAPAAPALLRLSLALEDRDRGVRTGAAVSISVIAIGLARNGIR